MRAFFEKIRTEITIHKRYTQAINRISRMRSPLEPDDLIGEFNVGIATALPKVMPFIGDPVEYLIANGFHRVRMAIRAEASKRIIQVCNHCGKQRPFRYDKCHGCQEKQFGLVSRFSPIVEDLFGNLVSDKVCAKPVVERELNSEEAVCQQI